MKLTTTYNLEDRLCNFEDRLYLTCQRDLIARMDKHIIWDQTNIKESIGYIILYGISLDYNNQIEGTISELIKGYI